ncbi:FtsX-like permease family protein [Candidatus Saccharibacteria bacterium]|nr:FtsX-like permease family protein [Candidatus Saccharibacteria bacterium]
MNFISRGIRNAFRNSIRTISIVLILSLSIGLAIIMVLARQAVQAKIDSVKGSIGNIITVSPAGARGVEGGGEPLTNDQINQVKSTDHVGSVTTALVDRLNSTDTNLQSAVEAGSFGRRQNHSESGNQEGGNIPPTVIAVGTSNPSSLQTFGGGTVSIVSGQTIDGGSNNNIALVGQGLASKNNLRVGSTFQAYGSPVAVSGIFTSGNRFSDNLIIMPVATEQRLSNQVNAITSAVVQVDSISNMQATVTAIQAKLGSAADVVSQQDTSSQALAPLESIKSVTFIGLVGSVVTGAIIIFLTMLMIVRERRREIGVTKAIGATNRKIVAQFIVEAVTLTLLAMVIGLGLGIIGSNPVTKTLVTSGATNNVQQAGSGLGTEQAGGTHAAGGIRGAAQNANTAIRNIQVAIGWNVLSYAVLAALLIAILGSAVPAWLIAKVRPAEVMRTE